MLPLPRLPLPTRRRNNSAALLVLLLAASACARAPRPAVPGATRQSRAAVAQLQRDVSTLLAAPELQRMSWGVLVRPVEHDETLFELNARKLMMPASNMKVLTMASAAERLGWDFRFETRFQTDAPIEAGRLAGDLVVVGGGDPTLNTRTKVEPIFDEWAAKLREAGITAIAGRLVGDDSRFDDDRFGAGWTLDNLPTGSAAPIGALQFNEDEVQIRIRPGAVEGERAVVEVVQTDSGLTIDHRVTTGAAGSPSNVDMRRWPHSPILQVWGTIPAGAPEQTRTVAVDNPTEYFIRALKSALAARGITVHGQALDIDDLPAGAVPADAAAVRTLFVHRSAPLSEIAKVMLTVSQNLYAETFVRVVGATEREPATAGSGLRIGREVLESWGVPRDSFVNFDGSGLSRYNYVSAETMVRILTRFRTDPKHATVFPGLLAVAGEEGTLRTRFKGTKSAGNVRAKTGSISNVRALSGYVTTLDGEVLAFSVLANHFTLPTARIDAVVERLVDRLANFSRR